AAKGKIEDLRNRLALHKKLGEELKKLLDGNDFRGAAVRARAAEGQGVGAAWAAAQHERVRATWRQFAAAKAADEAPLSEYEALLREYPNDPDAAAQADRLRKKLLAHRELDLGGGVKLRLVEIAIPPRGKTFRMGSPSEEPDRREDYEGPWEMTLTRGY